MKPKEIRSFRYASKKVGQIIASFCDLMADSACPGYARVDELKAKDDQRSYQETDQHVADRNKTVTEKGQRVLVMRFRLASELCQVKTIGGRRGCGINETFGRISDQILPFAERKE